jgi:hypothetical protein
MIDLLEKLRQIAENGGPGGNRDYGICHHISAYVDSETALYEAFSRWPEYSGMTAYPVPGPWPDDNPVHLYRFTPDGWVGEYGAARLRLVDFLIAECEAGRLE